MSTILEDLTWIHRGWTRFGIAAYRVDGPGLIRREVEDHGACAVVLPYDPERRVALLVAQPRVGPLVAGVAEPLLEAPAGCLDGERPEAAVRREALEEAGVRLGPLDLVVRGWSMPSLSTERPWHYLAPYGAADRIARGGGVAGEQEALSVHEIPLAALAASAARGELTDVKTLLLVLALQIRRPDLFAGQADPHGPSRLRPRPPPAGPA
ncbi:NUDIX domain-containing protein [Methylobacterium sp. NEAU 140]|uniref:NUDIX domain-containing protein n=1 Tax=Methylobacterium sp. NEAU 140 TaxID=3064945 RepID=UPI00273442B4|nr:NUDIX domain-containing protein [Methylobacterium sp. NEAU 140]MDP4025845.1 NUDIX domain-containing protein [Methylobacterium sp. NEAU 140]